MTIRALRGNPACSGGCAVQLSIDGRGRVYQLTPRLNVMAAHACGINDRAIGIEIGGINEHELLKNKRQQKAVIQAVYRLAAAYNINDINGNVRAKSGILAHEEVDKYLCQNRTGKPKIDPGDNYMKLIRDGVRSERYKRVKTPPGLRT